MEREKLFVSVRRILLAAVLMCCTLCYMLRGGALFAYNETGLSGVTVTASIPSGTIYWQPTDVKLTVGGTEGAQIYYTLDGSEPTVESMLYSGAVSLDDPGMESRVITLKAVAYKDGQYSDVASYTYEVLKNLARGKTVQLENWEPQTIANAVNAAIVCHANGNELALETWYGYLVNGDMCPPDWSAQYRNNEESTTYVQLDLGARQTFNRLFWQTSPYGGELGGLKIMVSDTEDGDYTVAYQTQGFDEGTVVKMPLNGSSPLVNSSYPNRNFLDLTFSETTGRYVRFYAKGYDAATAAASPEVRLTSFMLFNCLYEPVEYETSLDPSVPISTGKTYSIENYQAFTTEFGEENTVFVSNSSGHAIPKADGLATLASADLSNANLVMSYHNNADRSTYIQIDLGKNYLVNRFILHPSPILPASDEYLQDVIVSVSEDGNDYTPIFEQEGIVPLNQKKEIGNNGLNGETYIRYFDHTVSSQKARYVRVQAGKAGESQVMTNIQIFGYSAEKSGAWTQPEDISVNFDRIVTVDELTAELAERYPSATFKSTNGYIDSLLLDWDLNRLTDEALKAGGSFTVYGAIAEGQTFPDNVSNNYNAAVVATITLTAPDTAALSALIDEVKDLQQGNYTGTSWTAFASALADAREVLADVYHTQEEVNAAVTALTNAKNGLAVAADKTELNALIAEVSGTVETEYIAGSFEKFKTALQAANTVAEDSDASKEEVEAVLADLQNAFDGLLALECADDLKAVISTAKTNYPSAEESKYTSMSWANYTEALGEAENMVTGAETQKDLDDAKTELEAAIAALELRGDKTELTAAIAEAKKIDADGYTENSFAQLEDAIEAAEAVINDTDATESDIAAVLAAIEAKIAALVEVAGEELLAELGELLDEYEDLSAYTTDSTAGFREVWQNAKNLWDTPEVGKDDIESAMSSLQSAISRLVERGDKSELEALLAEAVDASKYTQVSMLAYTKACEDARLVVGDTDAIQSEVDAAVSAIKAAKNALVKLGDKTALTALVTECEAEMKENWSTESLETLAAAIEYAESVLADTQATEDAVAEATRRLTSAKDSLEKAEKTGCGSVSGMSGMALGGGLLAVAVAALVIRRRKKSY